MNVCTVNHDPASPALAAIGDVPVVRFRCTVRIVDGDGGPMRHIEADDPRHLEQLRNGQEYLVECVPVAVKGD